MTEHPSLSPPPRLAFPGLFTTSGWLLAFVFVIWCFWAVDFSPKELLFDGIPSMVRIFGKGIPPDFSRASIVLRAIVQTFQIALVGAFWGTLLSFPIAILATRSQTPHPAVYSVARLIIQICRTVPDLVWAVFFVATVGLGPFAGVLTITVDTIGFCGRFFAEAMEEADPAPQEALSALGSSRTGIVFTAVVSAATPSFINTSLYALEEAVRSSVVLGLVGAGGIGIEMSSAMGLGEYQRAATIVLGLLILVNLVEQVSVRLRRKFGE
jgi:phosphonate transport system permease protein